MKILYLNVYEAAFEVMLSGEKLREYRKPSRWMLSRLLNKDGTLKKIDAVKVISGYGAHRPYFIREFKGFYTSSRNFTRTFSNCLKVNIQVGDIIIKFGKLIHSSYDRDNELFRQIQHDAEKATTRRSLRHSNRGS